MKLRADETWAKEKCHVKTLKADIIEKQSINIIFYVSAIVKTHPQSKQFIRFE